MQAKVAGNSNNIPWPERADRSTNGAGTESGDQPDAFNANLGTPGHRGVERNRKGQSVADFCWGSKLNFRDWYRVNS